MKGLKDLKLIDNKTLEAMPKDKVLEEIKKIWKKMFELRMKLSLWELKQTHVIKVLRRYIAKLNTLVAGK